MKRLNLRLKLLLLLGGLTPTLAPAQLPPWYGPLPTWGGSFTYDIGAHPRVSGGSPYIGIVDIHQPATWSNQLWERPSGWIKIDPTQPEFRYWYGYAPTMAAGNWPISNTGSSQAFVVEVDQTNQTGPCYLWYNLMSRPDYLQGVLSGGGLLIGGGYADYGCHPTVAVQDPGVNSPGPKVVEVHQDQEGWGTLYYKVGTVIPYTEPGWTNKAYIAWGPSQAFDTGANPSIAFLDDHTLIQVHQDGPAPAGLWCSIGELNGSTIQWSPSTHYAFGANPSVSSVYNYGEYPIIVEVHQAAAGASTLYCCFGYLSGTNAIWGTDPQGNPEPWALAVCSPYGWGINPSLDPSSTGNWYLQEVHAGADGQGTLWTTTFTALNPNGQRPSSP